MANASAWAGLGSALDSSSRAADAWRRISEKPASIVLQRGKPLVALDVQTVRIEYDSPSNSERKGGAGMSSVQRVTVFGIRDHDSEADTDIARDDRFTYDGLQLRVVLVVRTLGEVQASCEVQG